MCRLLGVSRNACYQYCSCQQDRQPDPERQGMLAAVKEIAEVSGYSDGSRRMKRSLNTLGYTVGRRKARSLMREAGVKARYWKRYKVTTSSHHKQPGFENILSWEFTMAAPD